MSGADAPNFQDIQRQLDDMKALLLKLQTPPASLPPPPLLDFASFVEKKDWQGALEALPRLETLTKKLLEDIFIKDLSLAAPHKKPDRTALWKAILRTSLITPDQLDAIENPETGKTALMQIVVHDDAPDGEMIQWAVSKSSSPAFFKQAMTKGLCKSRQDLVKWTTFCQNVQGLRNLYHLRASDAELVFPRTVDSYWTWQEFCHSVGDETETVQAGRVSKSLRDCVQFWLDTVAPKGFSVPAAVAPSPPQPSQASLSSASSSS